MSTVIELILFEYQLTNLDTDIDGRIDWNYTQIYIEE